MMLPISTYNSDGPKDNDTQVIDLSLNYILDKDQNIHVNDIIAFIKQQALIENRDDFIPIDCSLLFPRDEKYGYLVDLVLNTTNILSSYNVVTQDFENIQSSIINTRDESKKRDFIIRYFSLIKDLELNIIYLFPNFHHIVNEIDKQDFHILHNLTFERNAFLLWFLNCSKEELKGTPVREDIARKVHSFSNEQLNYILKTSSKHTIMKNQEKAKKLKIFTSYSHVDAEDHSNFDKLLQRYLQNYSIAIWNDNHIKPGEEWDKEIKEQLFSASIVIFLISEEFLSSDYINRVEIQTTLERYEKSEVTIIPVILSQCDFKNSVLKKFEALPNKAKPISEYENQTSGWIEVVEK
jgi:hypothetical protein